MLAMPPQTALQATERKRMEAVTSHDRARLEAEASADRLKAEMAAALEKAEATAKAARQVRSLKRAVLCWGQHSLAQLMQSFPIHDS